MPARRFPTDTTFAPDVRGRRLRLNACIWSECGQMPARRFPADTALAPVSDTRIQSESEPSVPSLPTAQPTKRQLRPTNVHSPPTCQPSPLRSPAVIRDPCRRDTGQGPVSREASLAVPPLGLSPVLRTARPGPRRPARRRPAAATPAATPVRRRGRFRDPA